MNIEPIKYGVKIDTYDPITQYDYSWTGKGWAIRHNGMRLTHRGDWIWEGLPSSRTNQFYKRTLWEFEEGMQRFKQLIEELS